MVAFAHIMSKMSMSEAGRLGGLKTQQRRVNRYELNPKLCAFCKSKLPYKKRHNKYCDQSCAASRNNLGVVRNKRRKYDKPCLHCGNITKLKYCSQRCHIDHKWSVTKSEIEKSGVMPSKEIAKKYLSEVRGSKCEICGITEWCKKSLMLILDHIDGNSYNWSLINLRLLCSNCDSQTPTYKGRNAGNGRHVRRMRYQQGKSY